MSVNYFQKVRESVVSEIGMAPQGRRNEALNLAAYALGRHAHMDASNIDSSVIGNRAAGTRNKGNHWQRFQAGQRKPEDA
jgi:hypothetical protein